MAAYLFQAKRTRAGGLEVGSDPDAPNGLIARVGKVIEAMDTAAAKSARPMNLMLIVEVGDSLQTPGSVGPAAALE